MSSQHLSDEAVAAFADGVLSGHARDRATRHTNECAECAHAVKVQREAAWALRAAPAPALPTSLFERLKAVPQTTPITTLPTVVGPDGSTMLATFGAPMAALVPQAPDRAVHRGRTVVLTAAAVALAGTLAAGTAAQQGGNTHIGRGHVVDGRGNSGGPNVVQPVNP
jgi:anti-sigma factor RsiW